MATLVYRVVSEEDWQHTLKSGHVPRCGSDERSGFVHLSTKETLIETAELYFEPKEKPLALEIEPDALPGQLRWERVEGRDGALFPHLYADAIPKKAIRARIDLQFTDAGVKRGARTTLEDHPNFDEPEASTPPGSAMVNRRPPR